MALQRQGRRPADDDYETSAFMEGIIDLGAIAGAGTCFPSFLAETRSSSGPSSGLSLDAQLKDFALKSFQLCESSLDDAEGRSWSGNPSAGLRSGRPVDLGQGRGDGHCLRDRDVERYGQVLALRSAERRRGNVRRHCREVGTEVTAAPNAPVPVTRRRARCFRRRRRLPRPAATAGGRSSTRPSPG